MNVPYPTDYPFHVNEDGWPEPVHHASYPHEYYHDNGKTPYKVNSLPNNLAEQKMQINHDPFLQHRLGKIVSSDTNEVHSLMIRRHSPSSVDPTLQEIEPVIDIEHEPIPLPIREPIQPKLIEPQDPDDRPIKPMKDVSVYASPSLIQKQNKKAVSIIKPKPKPQSPIKYEQHLIKTPVITTRMHNVAPQREVVVLPPPPARTRVPNDPPRYAVRPSIIPPTPMPPPPQRLRTRQIIVEEYDVDDDRYVAAPVTYTTPAQKKVVSYRPVRSMTTREIENYEMSQGNYVTPVPPSIQSRAQRY